MTKIIGLEITKFGTPPLTFLKKVETLFLETNRAAIDIGNETKDKMRSIIKSNIRRKSGSTGNLEKSINVAVERGLGEFIVGVGIIQEMDINAPYWYLINFGGLSTAAKQNRVLYGNWEGGDSDPALRGTGVGTQSFFPGRQPSFPMTPRSPIAAMNYIEKTVNWANTIWRVHYSGRWNKVTIATAPVGGII